MKCERCSGSGMIMYPNTSTYMRRIGGQMMTEDVCNKCWGTGRADKVGRNLRELRLSEEAKARAATIKKEVGGE